MFDDFETLDVFGQVEILGHIVGVQMHFVSVNGGIVRSRQGTEIVTNSINEITYEGILVISEGKVQESLSMIKG